MVLVTFCPKAIAPTNSVIVAKQPAWIKVSDFDETDVAYEFATSLAPMPQRERQKKMTPIENSQSKSCMVAMMG